MDRNRLSNSQNHWQGASKKVLTVCSAGLLRSPTAAWILSNSPFNFNTRAVGASSEYALIQLDAVNVFWADEIIVMNESQKLEVEHIQAALTTAVGYRSVPVHVLDVPDNYGFRQPELVEIMTKKLMDLMSL